MRENVYSLMTVTAIINGRLYDNKKNKTQKTPFLPEAELLGSKYR